MDKTNYVIIDLEWNSTFSRKRKRSINEVIEIGAVKLDSELNPIDTFESLVRTSVGKWINGRVKQLTNLKMKDLKSEDQFNDVMSRFRKWVGRNPTVILTWSTSDIYVLMDNFEYFSGTIEVPFLHRYADLQRYVQDRLCDDSSRQLGLVDAAKRLGIGVDDSIHHRALYDSMISAKCLQKTFSPEAFERCTQVCDKDFYGRLTFKPYYITNPRNPDIQSEILTCTCPYCKNQMKLVGGFFKRNNSIRGRYYCSMCTNEYVLILVVKRKYDSVTVRRRIEFADETAV